MLKFLAYNTFGGILRRFLGIFFAFLSLFLLVGCGKKQKTVEDFYAEMLELRRNAGDSRIYNVSVYNGQKITNYKVLTKNQKVRVETLDDDSYTKFSNLYVDNGTESYTYDPITRKAKQIFLEKEKKMQNPMHFLVFWGKNDAGYLNNLYKFGRDTAISGIPCKVIRNIDSLTKKEGFSYCISPDYGVAVYLRIPNLDLKDNKKSEKITWVTKLEEDNLEDYLFELPLGAKPIK